jgi:hypothetical protein
VAKIKKGGEKVMWKAFSLLICIIFVVPAIVTAIGSSKPDVETADDIKIEREQEARYHGGYYRGYYRPGPYHHYYYRHHRWWGCVPPPPPPY